ncbi:MAG: FMN-binding protein [Candidatus Latescibacterota bacterium]
MSSLSRKDPLLLAYVGLGLALLPMVVLLAEAYPSYQQRMRQAAGRPPLAPIPELSALRSQVAALLPATDGCAWETAYAAEDEPRTGIARVYDLSCAGTLAYRCLILRHDIACGTCRDLLFGTLYDVPSRTWTLILLLEPFERKGGPVDATAFLGQFRGRSVDDRFVVGDNVDGLTGATKSVRGLIHRLHEGAQWLDEHPPVATTMVAVQPREQQP